MHSLGVDNTKKTIEIKAYAKLNLSLKIDGKLSSNFHAIRSLILPITLCDEIKISASPSSENIVKISAFVNQELHLENEEIKLLNSEKNLVCKAAKKILELFEEKFSITIELKKNIPTKAGLGGGSSDAAAILLAFSELFPENQKIKSNILNIASSLGSDVVSQLFGELIFVYGRGEKFSKVRIHPESDFKKYLDRHSLILLKPSIGVDTSWAYQLLSKDVIEDNQDNFQIADNFSFEKVGLSILERNFDFETNLSPMSFDYLCNDFEPIIRKNVSKVDFAYEELKSSGAIKVMLAGSGSCVFGVYKADENSLNTVLNSLKNKLGNDWFIKQCNFVT